MRKRTTSTSAPTTTTVLERPEPDPKLQNLLDEAEEASKTATGGATESPTITTPMAVAMAWDGWSVPVGSVTEATLRAWARRDREDHTSILVRWLRLGAEWDYHAEAEGGLTRKQFCTLTGYSQAWVKAARQCWTYVRDQLGGQIPEEWAGLTLTQVRGAVSRATREPEVPQPEAERVAVEESKTVEDWTLDVAAFREDVGRFPGLAESTADAILEVAWEAVRRLPREKKLARMRAERDSLEVEIRALEKEIEDDREGAQHLQDILGEDSGPAPVGESPQDVPVQEEVPAPARDEATQKTWELEMWDEVLAASWAEVSQEGWTTEPEPEAVAEPEAVREEAPVPPSERDGRILAALDERKVASAYGLSQATGVPQSTVAAVLKRHGIQRWPVDDRYHVCPEWMGDAAPSLRVQRRLAEEAGSWTPRKRAA